MRSTTGFAAAILLLLAVPIAFAAQLVADGSADLVIHLAIGTGCVLLAVAMFDFGLPRWVDWIGAAGAGTFGAIFLLQALSQLVAIDALTYVAFDVLGQEIEGVLPYLTIVWFVALLLAASSGKSRILGWIVMSIVIGVEVAAIVGPSVGIHVDSQKLLFLLPIVWLLVESAKRRADDGTDSQTPQVVDRHPAASVA